MLRAFLAMVWAVPFVGPATWTQSSWLPPVWKAEGNQIGGRFGGSVASAGDVNGDGFADVLVGADAFDDGQVNEGVAFLYLGSPTGPALAPSWSTGSDQAYSYLGSSVASAGDVNGDGFDDVLVGNYSYSGIGQGYEGRALLFLGSANGLGASPAWVAEGNQVAAYFGAPVASAGDVNGDGFDDVLVGAGAFDDGNQDEGAAFLYLGSAAGLGASPAWSAEGNQNFATFGTAASAGDVNGDGFGDVIVGAWAFNHGERDEGRAFLYLGSPSGLSPTAAWSAEGNQIDA